MTFVDFLLPKWKNSDASVRRHATGRITNQSLLTKIATNDKDWSVRLKAAERLTDVALAQRVFAEIAKNDRWEAGRAAVQQLTDQVLIGEVAKNAKDSNMRLIAVLKLTDQPALVSVAKDIYEEASVAAVERLSNQASLAEVAEDAKHNKVRMIAAERLTDQALAQRVFFELARQFPVINGVDLAALQKLTDQMLLANVAMTATPEKIRRLAVERLTDQAILAGLAKTAKDVTVRRLAAEAVTDQAVLAGLAKADIDDSFVCSTAVRRITDQGLLANVATTAKHNYVRLEAAAKVADQTVAQSVIAECVKKAHYSSGKGAVKQLVDQVLLADVANNAEDGEVRLAAAAKLVDTTVAQGAIAKAAKTFYLSGAGEEAVKRLTDQALLADVAQAAYDPWVRLAAAERLTDQALARSAFTDIAKSAKNPNASLAAANKLADQVLVESALAAIAISEDWERDLGDSDQHIYEPGPAQDALKGLTDMKLISAVATSASDPEVRMQAAYRLTDKALAQIVFADIAKNADNRNLRTGVQEAALRVITDQMVLAEIASTARDVEIRRTAASRLEQTNQGLDKPRTGKPGY